jgi:hypothetical protein
MAARTRSAAAKKAAAQKPAPAPEPEEVEEELEELEEEEFEEIEEAPAQEKPAGKKTRAADQVTFGVAHLAEYLSKKAGKAVTTRELRTLIRRMAREEKPGGPRVQREIVAGNRSRYDWPLGLKDPEVQAIVAAYLGGEADEAKKESLEALKAKNAEARAAKKAAAPKPTAKKAAAKKPAPPVVEEDDEELEFDDED